ncbi:class I SAM-dependent methyltransferase [Salicibibacter halophilus]|uniref:Class I SAM-dependent methyltransferase n=1 Tax=Salicibibacter halophilus TaxID=2502791 RepID=A0A514LM16_9BACI|nr:class I SAM-dependent methyltransferase [Salicibibacter halophilus]QDI92912.1 class I SAM-dependent methyltransferase [Salicibibacter halophilus]
MSMLLSRGYDVQGIDYSPEMLAVADEKIRADHNIARTSVRSTCLIAIGKPVDAIVVFVMPSIIFMMKQKLNNLSCVL